MTKINYLRKCFTEKFNENDLNAATDVGEALLREHWHNKNFHTVGYANDLFNLACVYDERDCLERAAELYSDSARQIAVVDGEQIPYAERISNLACVFARLGMTEPAYFVLGSAASIFSRTLGTNHPRYADCLYNLANIASDMGRRNEALRFHREALKIRQNEGHTDDIINSLHSIAFLYEAAAEYNKATHYAEAAMKQSISKSAAFVSACNYLAELYERDKKYDNALPLYDQVLEAALGETGREHSAYLNIALRRANLLALMDRPEEALSAHEEISTTFAKKSGTNHMFYANCLRGMAMLHKTLKNPTRSEELILEAMRIRRKMQEDITLDITFLIRLHLHENKPDKALEALIYALMCSGAQSPEFSELLNSLVDVFSRTENSSTHEFIDAIELLNDREKIRPILNKWAAWEKEIPSCV
jgi:tetratricopeptide (TPR) repeat protein